MFLISSYTTAREIFVNFEKEEVLKKLDEHFRSIDFISKVKCPVLFIHGKDDTLINYHESEILYEKANSIKEIILENGMGHNDIKWKKMGNYIMDFYKRKCSKNK